MPEDLNDWENQMSDEFERRVRDLHEAPLTLDRVKGTAVTIKRKRRIAVAGGILAVAAVITPIAILSGNGSDRADGIDPATSPSVSITDTSSPAPTRSATPPPDAVPDDLSLSFDYLEVGSGNAVLRESDGGTIELPRPDYTDAADLGGQIAAFRTTNGVPGQEGSVDILKDGAVTSTYLTRTRIVITPTGSAVAFITTKGKLLVVSAEGTSSIGGDVPLAPSLFPAAIIGDGDCALESGCHPFIVNASGANTPFEINYEGPDTDVAPGALRVNDADDDFLVTVQTEVTDGGSCGGLFDRRAQEFRFKTCEAQALYIAPDGKHVIGIEPNTDGLGTDYFSILDGTSGTELARYPAPEEGFVSQAAWADDAHAVATVYDGKAWSIVRLGVDGTTETLAGPTPGTNADSPYLLTGGHQR